MSEKQQSRIWKTFRTFNCLDATNKCEVSLTDQAVFQTRLHIHGKLIEQVHQARLLGLIISDDLNWKANAEYIVKKKITKECPASQPLRMNS